VVTRLLGGHLPSQLASAIDAAWRNMVFFTERPIREAIKHIIRADLKQQRANSVALLGDPPNGLGVHQLGLGFIGFGSVHVGVGGAIQKDVWPVFLDGDTDGLPVR